ncbi:hypothetical protein I4U23_012521 [Adineta vaga]|nr:hypothetical protein I4U23_012521 [Adineta vaga]
MLACLINQVESENISVCHFYGDPHIILFSEQLESAQNRYWCKLSGEHLILQNNYVQIEASMQHDTWLIEKFNMTFMRNNETLCTITDHEQNCKSSEIRIRYPSSVHMEIFYAIPDLYISITPHQYQYKWYDISIRMPTELIRQSNGLCITPSTDKCFIENNIVEDNRFNRTSKSICEMYLLASDQARALLNLPNDYKTRDHALLACIHDFETTNNKNVGKY